jgi:uncharacterized protein YhfF
MTRRVIAHQPDEQGLWPRGTPPGFYDSDCKYGAAGERLWVRDRARIIQTNLYSKSPATIRVRYEVDGTKSDWIVYPERLKNPLPQVGKCLSYGGYREASRITLEITNVRVERLNEISEEDAKAEGVPPIWLEDDDNLIPPHDSYREGFAELWDKINGKKHPWSSNPWVFVIEFRRLEP